MWKDSFFTSVRFLRETGLALVLVLSIAHLQAQDIETKRVQFEKGMNSATVEDKIKGDQIVDYILNAQKGQLMKIQLMGRT